MNGSKASRFQVDPRFYARPEFKARRAYRVRLGSKGNRAFRDHMTSRSVGALSRLLQLQPEQYVFALKGEADVDQVSVPEGEYIGIVTATADPDGSESDDVVFRIGTSAAYYTWIYSMGPIAATDQVYLANAGPIRFLCHSYNQ